MEPIKELTKEKLDDCLKRFEGRWKGKEDAKAMETARPLEEIDLSLGPLEVRINSDGRALLIFRKSNAVGTFLLNFSQETRIGGPGCLEIHREEGHIARIWRFARLQMPSDLKPVYIRAHCDRCKIPVNAMRLSNINSQHISICLCTECEVKITLPEVKGIILPQREEIFKRRYELGKSLYGKHWHRWEYHKNRVLARNPLTSYGGINTHWVPSDIDRLYRIQDGKCFYCPTVLNPSNDAVEHKIPLSRGGKNIFSNIAIACKKCNGKKSSLTEKEFRKKYGGEHGKR